MRILFHHRIASQDGQAVHIAELIAALRLQGHETLLVGPPGFETTGFGRSSAAIDWIKRSVPPALYELLEVVYNVKAFLRLWSAVRRFRPDVIYERFSLFLLAGLWVRRLTGLPLLLEVNSPLYEERANNDGLQLARLGRWAQRLLWTRVDHVLPVTAVLARIVADNGTPPAQMTVIPNGIDASRFGAVPETEAAKTALGLPPRLVLGFTGFVRGWNAVHRLIDFIAAHEGRLDLHLLVVGDGPARESLQHHAQDRGVASRLTITGVVARDDVARHVAAFDIAVLPALTAYSSPLKLFEYLALGRAIAAPNSENIREILTDDRDALLFGPEDGGMEAVLLRLCLDAGLRERLGAAGRQTITAKSLTWGHNATRVVAIGSELIARKRASRLASSPLDGVKPVAER